MKFNHPKESIRGIYGDKSTGTDPAKPLQSKAVYKAVYKAVNGDRPRETLVK